MPNTVVQIYLVIVTHDFFNALVCFNAFLFSMSLPFHKATNQHRFPIRYTTVQSSNYTKCKCGACESVIFKNKYAHASYGDWLAWHT